MVGGGLSASYTPVRFFFGARRGRGSGLRAVLFALECALGMVAVLLVAAVAHWAGWLLPVSVLLYLLIVIPIALVYGFWQAVIVSLSAVGSQSYFTTRHLLANPAADPANTVILAVFVLVALTVSKLSAQVTGNAREAESRGEQMNDCLLYTSRCV